MESPYNIIEFANTHSGNFDYALELINSFKGYNKGFGIKFQPFHPDSLATKDYEWYAVYQKLHFDPFQWKELIDTVYQTKDVWLDIFDNYGAMILEENHSQIFGVKFQASVLYNYALIERIKFIDLSHKKLIINIASYSLDEITKIIARISRELNPEEIVLEVGFQAYPTNLLDSGLGKIKTIREEISCRIAFADHVDGKSENSIWLPVIAMLEGANIIEKHVMLSGRKTEYDFFSSITPEKYETLVSKQKQYQEAINQPFINLREEEYLKNSLMIPLLSRDIDRGNLLNICEDVDYKRSGKKGLKSQEIYNLQAGFHILSVDKKANESFLQGDFKKATIATIIACRLKSSRLPRKALLHIGELTSVEFCISNALKFRNVNHTILATSTLESDSELKKYILSQEVIFHQGDPDDVIQRYLDIIRNMKIDVIIRVTADMPFIDNEICQILLESHFKKGADYTTATQACIGTNLEIINSKALEKVKQYFPVAEYSEYMTWYFKNNPEYFRLNFVDLPNDLIRNYRLTLDYQEDIDMFRAINNYFSQVGEKSYSLRDVFDFLDCNPKIASINSNKTVRYQSDNQLIEILNKETKIT
jgi:spore coat polysaccharide biosynthesis protein SpsF (cytidylyltransferase family)/sialic acid synthase SpsE